MKYSNELGVLYFIQLPLGGGVVLTKLTRYFTI